MATKDDIRAAIFSGSNFRREAFTFLGQSLELRQPTVGQITRLADDKNNKNRIIEIIIDSAYVPGTDDKVFSSADYDSLLEVPSGEWVTDFTAVWNKLAGNVKEAEKN
jgi:hypothetical protein